MNLRNKKPSWKSNTAQFVPKASSGGTPQLKWFISRGLRSTGRKVRLDACTFRLTKNRVFTKYRALELTGRDEARDYMDVLFVHAEVLSLGALIWGAVRKDPGSSPLSLPELLRCRARYRLEEFDRLHLDRDVDLQNMKTRWLLALHNAFEFVNQRDPDQAGCLYHSVDEERFVAPDAAGSRPDGVSPHFGRPGGVLPRLFRGDALADLAQSAW